MDNAEVNEYVADVRDRKVPVDEVGREAFNDALVEMLEAVWSHTRAVMESLASIQLGYRQAAESIVPDEDLYEAVLVEVRALAQVLDTP